MPGNTNTHSGGVSGGCRGDGTPIVPSRSATNPTNEALMDPSQMKEGEPSPSPTCCWDGAGDGAGGGQPQLVLDSLSFMHVKRLVVKPAGSKVSLIDVSFSSMLCRRVYGNQLECYLSNQVSELSTGAAVTTAPTSLNACCAPEEILREI